MKVASTGLFHAYLSGQMFMTLNDYPTRGDHFSRWDVGGEKEKTIICAL